MRPAASSLSAGAPRRGHLRAVGCRVSSTGMTRTTALLFLALLAAPLPAQDMLGIDAGGGVFLVDSATGTGAPLGSLGYSGAACMAKNSLGELYAICDDLGTGRQALVRVDPQTGAGSYVTALAPFYAGSTFRGMAFDAADVLYAEHTSSYLVTIDPATGQSSFVGKPATFDMRAIAFVGPDLYGWDLVVGLVKFDLVGGGPAVDVDPAVPGSSAVNSLATSALGQLFGAGSELYAVSHLNGTLSLVGSGGYSGLTALEFLSTPAGPSFSVSNLVAGGVAVFQVTQCGAGDTVLIGYSLTGPGPTGTPLGNVSMSPPIRRLPALTADPSGTAQIAVPVPPAAAGVAIWTQAAELHAGGGGQLSNALGMVVQ